MTRPTSLGFARHRRRGGKCGGGMARRKRLPVGVGEAAPELEVVRGGVGRGERSRATSESLEYPGDAAAEQHCLSAMPAEVGETGMIADAADHVERRSDHD